MSPPRFDALSFVALFLIFFLGFKAFSHYTPVRAESELPIQVQLNLGSENKLLSDQPEPDLEHDQESVSTGGQEDVHAFEIIAPYEDYAITQGLHGFSYGHMAVDLAAGKGEKILSPIDGKISEHYIDDYGNTTLVIENKKYRITLLHGEYSVNVGQKVKQGDVIGREGNRGYTMDMAGNLCYGRPNCGFHTHINIYDKRIEANVNPLDVMNQE